MSKQFVYVAFIIKVFKLFYLQVAKYVVYATNLWILFVLFNGGYKVVKHSYFV